jgi:GT2 family glycosyltransferase
MSPKVGLVTVLYNAPQVLPDFYKSLSIQTYQNYKLYVIDNSTNPDSRDLATTLMSSYGISNYELIVNDINNGVAGGNNQGVEAALRDSCDYVLLLNNDIEILDSDAISTLVSSAVAEKLDMVVPKIFFYGTQLIWCAGGQLFEWKGDGNHYGFKKNDALEFNVKKIVEYSPTCFMLISRVVFEKTGLFDEKYFVYYDDTDFVLRARRLGFSLTYIPEVDVYHKVSTSTGGDESPFSVFYMNRNRVYFLRKNYSGIKFFSALLYSSSVRFIKIVFRKPKLALTYLRATVSGLHM